MNCVAVDHDDDGGGGGLVDDVDDDDDGGDAGGGGGDLMDDVHNDDGQHLLAWIVFSVHRVQRLNILWKLLFSGIHLAPSLRRILGGV